MRILPKPSNAPTRISASISSGVGVTRQQTIAVNPNTYAATRPGVFAAGDVRVKALRQIATAVGDGALAAMAVEAT